MLDWTVKESLTIKQWQNVVHQWPVESKFLTEFDMILVEGVKWFVNCPISTNVADLSK